MVNYVSEGQQIDRIHITHRLKKNVCSKSIESYFYCHTQQVKLFYTLFDYYISYLGVLQDSHFCLLSVLIFY